MAGSATPMIDASMITRNCAVHKMARAAHLLLYSCVVLIVKIFDESSLPDCGWCYTFADVIYKIRVYKKSGRPTAFTF